MTFAALVGPGERDDDASAMLLDAVKPIVVVTGLPALADPPDENLTGLVRAASGRRRPPEARQATTTPPLHRRIDQRHERLDVARTQSLEGAADRLSAHFAHRTPASAAGQAFAAVARSSLEQTRPRRRSTRAPHL